MHDAQRRNRSETVRSEQRGVPGDDGAPIVPDDRGFSDAERVEEGHHVADEMEDRVVGGLGRRGALAVAAHVWREHAIAGRGERRDLVTP